MRILAETLTEAGRRAEAIGLWDEIVSRIDALRSSVSGMSRLEEFDERYNDHYVEAIEANLDLGRHASAADLIQRTRARAEGVLHLAAGGH
jgi:hypothetical protein